MIKELKENYEFGFEGFFLVLLILNLNLFLILFLFIGSEFGFKIEFENYRVKIYYIIKKMY